MTLLFAFVFYSLINWFAVGKYHPQMVVPLAAVHFLLLAWVMARRWPRPNAATLERILALLLTIFGVCLARAQYVSSSRDELNQAMDYLVQGVPVLATGLWWTLERPASRWRMPVIWALLAVLTALLIAVRELVPLVVAEPHIDVWVECQMAAEYLLDGVDPYGAYYPDLYNGAYGYATGFPYLPGWLLWSVVFKWFGPGPADVRYALIIAELVLAGGLLTLARQSGLRAHVAAMAAVLWLSVPIGLHTIMFAWIDPLLSAGLIWTAVALRAKHWVAAGVLLGAVTATKQYAVVAVGFAGVGLLRMRGLRWTLRTALLAAAVALALLLPFILWDPEAFYRITVLKYVGQPMRTDALSLLAHITRFFDKADVPFWRSILYCTSLAIVAALLLRLIIWPSQNGKWVATWLGISVAAYGTIWLFSHIAFCNYYYFCASLLFATFLIHAEAGGREHPQQRQQSWRRPLQNMTVKPRGDADT